MAYKVGDKVRNLLANAKHYISTPSIGVIVGIDSRSTSKYPYTVYFNDAHMYVLRSASELEPVIEYKVGQHVKIVMLKNPFPIGHRMHGANAGWLNSITRIRNIGADGLMMTSNNLIVDAEMIEPMPRAPKMTIRVGKTHLYLESNEPWYNSIVLVGIRR